MTSFGRGRGWLINQLQSKEQVLRRPGDATCGDNAVRDITNKITAYDVRDYASPELIQEIVDLLTSTVNKDNLKDTCNALWKQAILDSSFTTKTAMIFSDIKVYLIEDNSKDTVRSNFLRFLQDNYMSKEKSKVENGKTFMNVVLLHAQVYYYMRSGNGMQRLRVLAEPLIHYLEDILQDDSNDNIYFVMIQMLRCGKDLHAACPEQQNSLIMTIKQMLLKENSPQNRAMLLLMIELANNAYEITDPQLKHFYLSNIKSLSFEYPFSQMELKVIAETTKTDYDDQLPEVDDNQQIINADVKNNIPEQGNYSKNNVPRAIRGLGALDKPKIGDNFSDKLRSLKIAPPRHKNNKGWDHDDRFHKDYE